MPAYTLSSGESFQTILIPKGTILFRGLNMNLDPAAIMTDLFGPINKDDGDYCVDPHHNVFFYPSPFISDVVEKYPIHCVFIVNYDIEIISMVLPSIDFRDKPGTHTSAYESCSQIGHVDLCNKRLNPLDPCLTSLLIREYPHIQGYIGIHPKDAYRYDKGFMKHAAADCASITDPFVLPNATGVRSIPEIALFPYHTRPYNPNDSIDIHYRAPNNEFGHYIIQNRALLNYFPLAYITETRVVYVPELRNYWNIVELAKSDRTDPFFTSTIMTNINQFMDIFLSPTGIFIEDVNYKCTIDVRTGFYAVKMRQLSKNQTMISKTLDVVIEKSPDDYDLEHIYVPLHYSSFLKKQLHRYLSRLTHGPFNMIDRNLSNLQQSYSKYYQFGKPYLKLEATFPRPEFVRPSTRRYTRKVKHAAI